MPILCRVTECLWLDGAAIPDRIEQVHNFSSILKSRHSARSLDAFKIFTINHFCRTIAIIINTFYIIIFNNFLTYTFHFYSSIISPNPSVTSSLSVVVSALWYAYNGSGCISMTLPLTSFYSPWNHCGYIKSLSSQVRVMSHHVFVKRRGIITSFFHTYSQYFPTICDNKIFWLEAGIFPSSQTSIFLLSYNHSSRCFPGSDSKFVTSPVEGVASLYV